MNEDKTGEECLVSESESHIAEPVTEALPAIESGEPDTAPDTDYAALVETDMAELTEEFSSDRPIKITDLKDPLRYGALRDLGLSPKEAYLASGGKMEKQDNKAHLFSTVPTKISSRFSEMPRAELYAARELFSDMSDGEIRNLYKKVTQ